MAYAMHNEGLRIAANACQNTGFLEQSRVRDVADEVKTDQQEPITIKKYANRRLYNTATSSYVTLEDLARMVRGGREFVVYDAKTGEDITRTVLTQIIFEEENKGQNLLPINFLRQLICYYDDSLKALVPSYLDMTMDNFVRHQDQLRGNLEKAFGEPFRQFEELTRQNLQIFQQAMGTLNPFLNMAGAARQDQPSRETPSEGKGNPEKEAASDVEVLRRQLEEMQSQINQLMGKKG